MAGLKLYENFKVEKRSEEISNEVKKELNCNPSEIVIVYEKKSNNTWVTAILRTLLFFGIIAGIIFAIIFFLGGEELSVLINDLLIKWR